MASKRSIVRCLTQGLKCVKPFRFHRAGYAQLARGDDWINLLFHQAGQCSLLPELYDLPIIARRQDPSGQYPPQRAPPNPAQGNRGSVYRLFCARRAVTLAWMRKPLRHRAKVRPFQRISAAKSATEPRARQSRVGPSYSRWILAVYRVWMRKPLHHHARRDLSGRCWLQSALPRLYASQSRSSPSFLLCEAYRVPCMDAQTAQPSRAARPALPVLAAAHSAKHRAKRRRF